MCNCGLKLSNRLGKSLRTDDQCSSDLASPNFGKHRSSEEVIEAFRPSQQTENNVRERLIDNGIPSKRISHSENKGWFASTRLPKRLKPFSTLSIMSMKTRSLVGLSLHAKNIMFQRMFDRTIDYISQEPNFLDHHNLPNRNVKLFASRRK
jgi:hypothetical protein